MDVFLGLLIISIGSFGQSSSYVPIKKIKSWEWENFWLVQGFFAWIIFPIVGTFLAVSDLSDLIQILSVGGATKSILYGLFWGIGGVNIWSKYEVSWSLFGAVFVIRNMFGFWYINSIYDV